MQDEVLNRPISLRGVQGEPPIRTPRSRESTPPFTGHMGANL